MRIFSKRAAPKAGWALLFVSVLALVALMPIAWMTLSAFKPEDEINQIPPTFLPDASTSTTSCSCSRSFTSAS